MLDPIADMLTRIRNASRAGHASVVLPASKMKYAIAEILVREGFLDHVETMKDETEKEVLKMNLKYEKQSQTSKTSAIQDLERVSKEGSRVYIKKGDIGKVKNGYGIAIVSTSKGIMTGRDAYRAGLGGELVCKVW